MRLDGRRKMALSGALLALAVALAALSRTPYSQFALGAMALCFVADALLAGYPSVLSRLRHKLILGGVVFALAHLLYLYAGLRVLREARGVIEPLNALPWMAAFALLCGLHHHVFYTRPGADKPFAFSLAATAYLLLVGLMASVGIRVGVSTDWRVWELAAGALLFFASDCVLVAREYGRGRRPLLTTIVWMTYIAAQTLLLAGFFKG